MAVETHGSDLVQIVAVLAAGVVAVPLFKRLGLGSVLGYLVVGLAVVALLGPVTAADDGRGIWGEVGVAVTALVGLVAAGRCSRAASMSRSSTPTST